MSADTEGLVLTENGLDLWAKANANSDYPLKFTKVAYGSGSWAEETDPVKLTEIVKPELSLAIQSVEAPGNGTVEITVAFLNTDLTEGFYHTEVGIYVEDPSTNKDVLYAVDYRERGGFIPPGKGAYVIEDTAKYIVEIGNTATVTAVINDMIVIATKQNILDHNTDPEAHADLLARLAVGTPVILSPSDGDENIGETPVITFIKFVPLFANTSEQALQVQIAEANGSYETPLHDTGWLTTIADGYIVPSGLFKTGIKYKVHYRRRLNTGQISEYSESVTFTTKDLFNYVARPVNSSPADKAANVGETPVLVGSEFAVVSTELAPDVDFSEGTEGGWKFSGDPAPAVSNSKLRFTGAENGSGISAIADFAGAERSFLATIVVDSMTTGSLSVYIDADNAVEITEAGKHELLAASVDAASRMYLLQSSDSCDAVISKFSIKEQDEHIASRFWIKSGGEILHDSGVLGQVTQYQVPAGILTVAEDFTFEEQYTGKNFGDSDHSLATTFRTAAAFITGDEAVYPAKWNEYENASAAGIALDDDATLYSAGVDQDEGDSDWLKCSVRAKVRDYRLDFDADKNKIVTSRPLNKVVDLITDLGCITNVPVSNESNVDVVPVNYIGNGEVTNVVTSSVDSYYQSYVGANVFDGNPSTRWFSQRGVKTATLYFSTTISTNEMYFKCINNGAQLELFGKINGKWVLADSGFVVDEGITFSLASQFSSVVEYKLHSPDRPNQINSALGIDDVRLNLYRYVADISSAGFDTAPTKVALIPTLKAATGPAGTPFTADNFSEIDIEAASIGNDADADRPDFVLLESAKITPVEGFRRVALGLAGLPEGSECRIAETQINTWKSGS